MASTSSLQELSLAQARRAHRAPRSVQSLEELLDWLPDHTPDVTLEGRLDRPIEWRPSQLYPPEHPERWSAAMVDVNPRTLPAPVVHEDDGGVTLRWDSDAFPEFWLEVGLGHGPPVVRGRGVPHDATVTRADGDGIRWDSATAPCFWLQVNLRK